MSAPQSISRHVEAQIKRHAAPSVRLTTVRRLAAMVTGILGSAGGTLRRVGREVEAMGLSRGQAASAERRLRRTLADPGLDDGVGDGALLNAAVEWPGAGEPVVRVRDESTTPGGTPVLRLSVADRGSCVPLAWAVWRHQAKLPRGEYWRHVAAGLDRVQALRPAGLPVVVLAARAYDVPAVRDRLNTRGWGWMIRVKARSKLVWRAADGGEQPLRDRVGAALEQPGDRVRETGSLFKKAGWRPVHLVGAWGHGYTEPLVVATNLDPCWTVLSRYARRCWIEAAFRQDKSKGWDWHRSQVRDPSRQARLLVVLAWASLLVLSLGAAQAAPAGAAVRARARWPNPSHPRASLFSLGLGQVRAWLYGTLQGQLPWRLPHLTRPSWCAEWLMLHDSLSSAETVRP